MKLLVVTPYTAPHFDAGLFWAKEMALLGHEVILWDYRAYPQLVCPDDELASFDGSVVFKGESIAEIDRLPQPKVCYWPDDLGRTPGIENVLAKYDEVFTPVRPTPDGMVWLPTGWDPDLHRNYGKKRWINSIYVGTKNSQYKCDMVHQIRPEGIAGNGWGKDFPPVYTDDLVGYLNDGKVLINIHQNPSVGVNRKFFELVACGLTITDRAPGIDEILGKELANQLCFTTPEEAKDLIDQALALDDEERSKLWKLECAQILNFTYANAAREVLKCLELLLLQYRSREQSARLKRVKS